MKLQYAHILPFINFVHFDIVTGLSDDVELLSSRFLFDVAAISECIKVLETIFFNSGDIDRIGHMPNALYPCAL